MPSEMQCGNSSCFARRSPSVQISPRAVSKATRSDAWRLEQGVRHSRSPSPRDSVQRHAPPRFSSALSSAARTVPKILSPALIADGIEGFAGSSG